MKNRTRSQLLVFVAVAILSSQAFLAPPRFKAYGHFTGDPEVYATSVAGVCDALVGEEEGRKASLVEFTDWFAEATRYFQGDEVNINKSFDRVHGYTDPEIETSSAGISEGRMGTRQEDLLPLRIQRTVGHLWHDANDGGRMDYLSKDDRRRIKVSGYFGERPFN